FPTLRSSDLIRFSGTAARRPILLRGRMAPRAGRPAPPLQPAAAPPRPAAPERKAAPDSPHRRADAAVLGGEPRPAAEAARRDLVSANRRYRAGRFWGEGPRPPARRVASRGAAPRRQLRGRGQAVLRRQHVAGAGRRAGMVPPRPDGQAGRG